MSVKKTMQSNFVHFRKGAAVRTEKCATNVPVQPVKWMQAHQLVPTKVDNDCKPSALILEPRPNTCSIFDASKPLAAFIRPLYVIAGKADELQISSDLPKVKQVVELPRSMESEVKEVVESPGSSDPPKVKEVVESPTSSETQVKQVVELPSSSETQVVELPTSSDPPKVKELVELPTQGVVDLNNVLNYAQPQLPFVADCDEIVGVFTTSSCGVHKSEEKEDIWLKVIEEFRAELRAQQLDLEETSGDLCMLSQRVVALEARNESTRTKYLVTLVGGLICWYLFFTLSAASS
jgi:hypothetical protein